MQQLRRQLSSVKGVNTFIQIPPSIRIGGNSSKSLYQFTLQDTDLENLYDWAPKIETRIGQIRGLQDVTSDLRIANPQITVDIDRDKARTMGISASDIENTLYNAFGQRQISTIYTASNEYYVIMEVLPQYQRDPVALSKLYVRSSNPQPGVAGSTLVPLSAVTRLRQDVAPVSVAHYGQLPAVTISFNLAPGVSIGQAVDEIEETMRQMNVPSTVTTTFQGTAQAFQESLKNTWILLGIAILVIYLVLGVLYESYIHPITILSGLPSAALGALLILMLFHVDLNLYAIVGILLLIGIVKKNAIMMIDFALEAQRTEGRSPEEAIFQGSDSAIPADHDDDTGGALQHAAYCAWPWRGRGCAEALGLAVVGGLMVSQLVTLYLTPVMYLYMEGAQAKVRSWKHRKRVEPEDIHAEPLETIR